MNASSPALLFTFRMARRACACLPVALCLALASTPAAAENTLRMQRMWNDTIETQIRNQAHREGIEMSNVTVRADVRRKSIELSGTVEEPGDVRQLVEITESSGMASQLENKLSVRHLPMSWPRMICKPLPELDAENARRARELLTTYETQVAAYNAGARSPQRTAPEFRDIWVRLTGLESELLNSDWFAVSNAPPAGVAPLPPLVRTNQLFRDAADIMQRVRQQQQTQGTQSP